MVVPALHDWVVHVALAGARSVKPALGRSLVLWSPVGVMFKFPLVHPQGVPSLGQGRGHATHIQSDSY